MHAGSEAISAHKGLDCVVASLLAMRQAVADPERLGRMDLAVLNL